MMSLRYHVVSLAAVIVALGIGMLIGATMVGDRGMMKQQELLISRLDADFERLVGDRDQLLPRRCCAGLRERSSPLGRATTWSGGGSGDLARGG